MSKICDKIVAIAGRASPRVTGTLLSIWCVCCAVFIVVGTARLWNYDSAPGLAASAPKLWPSHSHLRRGGDRFTVVMFAHPNCPCTQASMAELEVLVTRAIGRVQPIIVFYRPATPAAEAHKSDLWQRAERVPGATVVFDDLGAETRRFGSWISGQILMYDPEGKLVFSGGITATRGHEGDNAGLSAVIRAANGEHAVLTRTPVFGCSLHDPGSIAERRNAAWHRN